MKINERIERTLRSYHTLSEGNQNHYVRFASLQDASKESAVYTVEVEAPNSSIASGMARGMAERMGLDNVRILGINLSNEFPEATAIEEDQKEVEVSRGKRGKRETSSVLLTQ